MARYYLNGSNAYRLKLCLNREYLDRSRDMFDQERENLAISTEAQLSVN